MKLVHIGIVVSSEDMDGAIRRYGLLGYSSIFRVVRMEPWIGEIVGIPGACIDICLLKKAEDPVCIELLGYRSNPSPRLGIQHLCYEVEDIGAALRTFLIHFRLIGKARIPDGPNTGAICAYVKGVDDDIIELVQRPHAPYQESLR